MGRGRGRAIAATRLAALLVVAAASCGGGSDDADLACPSDQQRFASVSDLPPTANASEAFDQAVSHLADNPNAAVLGDAATWRPGDLAGDTATWEQRLGGRRTAIATFEHGPSGWTFSQVRFCTEA